MKTKYIEIHLAYETDEEIEAIMAAIKKALPNQRFQISWEQGVNKPEGWKGFNV